MTKIRNKAGDVKDVVKGVGLFIVDYFRTQPIVGFLLGTAIVLLTIFFLMLGKTVRSESSPPVDRPSGQRSRRARGRPHR
jgi:hypothetical protein